MGSLWNRSGTFERTGDDVPAPGAKAYFFLGATTTPLTVYQDAAESSAHEHPLEADAYGRWPAVFVPYTTSFDVRVTTSDDVQLTYTLEIPNPDPIDLSVTIDPLEKVATGMIHAELIDGTRAGYVRLNGRTLGNAVSGATERANADTEDLFTYLWNALDDTIAPVSSGRGGAAASDYAANKTIVLPSCRGATFIGLDTMGNSAASAFGTLTFTTGDETTPGSQLGTNGITIAIANLPAHTHTGTTSTDAGHTHTGTSDGTAATGTTDSGGSHSHTATTGTESASHQHTYNEAQGLVATSASGSGSGFLVSAINSVATGSNNVSHTHSLTTSTASAHTHTFTGDSHTHTFTTNTGGSHSHTFTTSSTGSGTQMNNLAISRVVTWYIKL